MQVDDVVWEIINTGHCSFKMKTVDRNFCRNPYNLTGLCSKQTCPLANSNYATIIEKKGKCYLYKKVVERVQRPAEMWEEIELDKNYEKGLQQIEEHLQYWSGFIIHKSKQRFTKLRQMLNRIRKLKLKGYEEYSVINKKVERREVKREAKSLVAADIENNIKEELLARLKKGVYGDIYNIKSKVFNKVIEQREDQEQLEEDEQMAEEIDNISDLNSEELNEYVVDFDSDSEEEEEEEEKEEQEQIKETKLKTKQPKNKKKKVKVDIQYEDEEEYEQEKVLN